MSIFESNNLLRNIDDLEQPLNQHALLMMQSLNDKLSLTGIFSKPEFSEAPDIKFVESKILEKISELHRGFPELYMRLDDSMIEERAYLMTKRASNDIAIAARRGTGNLLLASKSLYSKLENLPFSKTVESEDETLKQLILNYFIKVYQIDNFDQLFPNCLGILTYWRSNNDGPLSVCYRTKDGTLEYDIKTLDEVLDNDESVVTSSPEFKAATTSDYFLRLVE